MENLMGELTTMKTLDIKPNYSALSEKYGIDRRTIKKYDLGYGGKPTTKSKRSKLSQYKDEIKQKINLAGSNIRSTYEFFNKKYTDIGTYSNFKAFVHKNSLIDSKEKKVHPRFETEPGEQLQFDWKEDITMVSKNGELFEFNLFAATLSWSRMHIFVYSVTKTRYDVQRCLIQVFKTIGGVPKQILTDNMRTVVDIETINGKVIKKINPEFKQFAKDMGTEVKTCEFKHPWTKR